VRNAAYTCLIEGFTSTTYAMVIVSDKSIQPATVLINIEASSSRQESSGVVSRQYVLTSQ
tara:strand:- start:178 stop:357 length:180 start_codon:yes stop_codon:yes gene_type:complete